MRPRNLIPLLALAAAAAVGATAAALPGDSSGPTPAASKKRHFVAQDRSQPKGRRPIARPRAGRWPVAYVRRSVQLYDRPGGSPRLRIAPKSAWDSPRVMGIARSRRGWVAVLVPELENGEMAWLPADRAILDSVGWSLHADLSERTLVVRHRRRAVRRMAVAIGRPGHETPTGRFAVTDKLAVADAGSPYGCCVLALSGHQPNPPPGWPGGDRLAVHGTTSPGTIGASASFGCLRAVDDHMRWLIETIPLGAPVFIRA